MIERNNFVVDFSLESFLYFRWFLIGCNSYLTKFLPLEWFCHSLDKYTFLYVYLSSINGQTREVITSLVGTFFPFHTLKSIKDYLLSWSIKAWCVPYQTPPLIPLLNDSAVGLTDTHLTSLWNPFSIDRLLSVMHTIHGSISRPPPNWMRYSLTNVSTACCVAWLFAWQKPWFYVFLSPIWQLSNCVIKVVWGGALE